MRSSACSFDNFGFCVDQMVFDEIQACFNVCIFKLDEVQACSDLFLHRYLIELVTSGILVREGEKNIRFLVCKPTQSAAVDAGGRSTWMDDR